MRPPLRIAVLECDTPQPKTKERYGGYGGLFEHLIRAAIVALDKPDILSQTDSLNVTKYDVEHEDIYPNLDDIDAILISGSKHNSFENDPWILKLVDFTKRVLAQDRVRIIGVCFGHQIVGRALGAKVGRSNEGWEIAVCPVELTPKGKDIFHKDDLNIQQMHRDVVFDLPADTELLGHSLRCDVQGMYRRGSFITVQGHPEFNKDIVTEILGVRYSQGIFDQSLYAEAIARVGNEHDGVRIAVAFLEFLLDDESQS